MIKTNKEALFHWVSAERISGHILYKQSKAKQKTRCKVLAFSILQPWLYLLLKKTKIQ